MKIDKLKRTCGMFFLAGLLAVPGLTGCEDEPPPPPPKKKAGGGDAEGEEGGGAKPAPRAAAAAPKGAGALQIRAKIPEQFRRELKERDFRPDPLGEENRDPFFSYVLEKPRFSAGAGVPQMRDTCVDREWRGQAESIRDMRLMAIILQGTRSWAQFIDRGSMGHIVERGFCLGKEKAVVDHIGDNFVRVKITPEAPPGAATPEPVLEDFALYPAQMDLKQGKDN